MTSYMWKNPKKSIKTTIRAKNEFSKIVGYKINAQNRLYFIMMKIKQEMKQGIKF